MVGKERESDGCPPNSLLESGPSSFVVRLFYKGIDRSVLLEVLFLPIMCVCDQEIRTQQKYLASVETPGRFLINDEFRNGKSPTIGFTTPRVLQMYGFQYWLE